MSYFLLCRVCKWESALFYCLDFQPILEVNTCDDFPTRKSFAMKTFVYKIYCDSHCERIAAM